MDAEQQERKQYEEKADEELRATEEEHQKAKDRFEEVLVAHRNALEWLGSVGDAAPAPQLEDKGAEALTREVTVAIEHEGHLGIEFAIDSSNRIFVSTVDPTSRNATEASQRLQRGQQLLSIQRRQLESCFQLKTIATLLGLSIGRDEVTSTQGGLETCLQSEERTRAVNATAERKSTHISAICIMQPRRRS